MSAATSRYSNYPVAALIREAPLSAPEKLLLFVIASHKRGKSFARADTLQRQTGIGRTKFYEIRGNLIELGILVNREVAGRATVYTIRRTALERLLDAPSSRKSLPPPGTPAAAAPQGTPAVPRHTTPAPRRHQKQNPKKNNEDSLNMKNLDIDHDLVGKADAGAAPVVRRVRRPTTASAPTDGPAGATSGQRTTGDVRRRLAAAKGRWEGGRSS